MAWLSLLDNTDAAAATPGTAKAPGMEARSVSCRILLSVCERGGGMEADGDGRGCGAEEDAAPASWLEIWEADSTSWPQFAAWSSVCVLEDFSAIFPSTIMIGRELRYSFQGR